MEEPTNFTDVTANGQKILFVWLACLVQKYKEPIQEGDRPRGTSFLKAASSLLLLLLLLHLCCSCCSPLLLFTSVSAAAAATLDKRSGCSEEQLSLQPHGTIETPSMNQYYFSLYAYMQCKPILRPDCKLPRPQTGLSVQRVCIS